MFSPSQAIARWLNLTFTLTLAKGPIDQQCTHKAMGSSPKGEKPFTKAYGPQVLSPREGCGASTACASGFAECRVGRW